MHHHAPDQQIGILPAQRNRRRVGIAGLQTPSAGTSLQPTQHESAFMHRHHGGSWARRHAAVDHQQIAMVDPLPAHGLTIDPHQKGGTGTGDQDAIEIDRRLDVVVSRTGEAGRHRLQGEGQEQGLLVLALAEGAKPDQISHRRRGEITGQGAANPPAS